MLTRPESARWAQVPGPSTSGRCSTDESVVPIPVARHRHPILPWALVPFEVHRHRCRSSPSTPKCEKAAPTIPPRVRLARESRACRRQSLSGGSVFGSVRVGSRPEGCARFTSCPMTPMGFLTSKISLTERLERRRPRPSFRLFAGCPDVVRGICRDRANLGATVKGGFSLTEWDLNYLPYIRDPGIEPQIKTEKKR